MEDLEQRLRLAVVAYVGGTRPPVSCREAAKEVLTALRIPLHRFSVHKFHPEYFLVVFASQELRNKALSEGTVEYGYFKLFIKPWLKQAQAVSRVMRTQVDLMIEGIPSHAWTTETAAELLGSSCLVESLAPETENREDLSLFKLRAWCVDPDEVPVDKRLWVPEPEVFGGPAVRRPTSRALLEYKTLIHIGRMRDHEGPERWLRPPSSDGSGQSGMPDDSEDFSGLGEWLVLTWTR